MSSRRTRAANASLLPKDDLVRGLDFSAVIIGKLQRQKMSSTSTRAAAAEEELLPKDGLELAGGLLYSEMIAKLQIPTAGIDKSDLLSFTHSLPGVKLFTLWNSKNGIIPNKELIWGRNGILSQLKDAFHCFDVKLEDVVDKNLEVHIATVRCLNVGARNKHTVKLMDTNSICYPNSSYLQLDSNIGELLTPGLKVGDVVAVLGGLYNIIKDTLYAGGHATNYARIVHFVRQEGPDNRVKPYKVPVDTNNFQLEYRSHNKFTLLEVTPIIDYSSLFKPYNKPKHASTEVKWKLVRRSSESKARPRSKQRQSSTTPSTEIPPPSLPSTEMPPPSPPSAEVPPPNDPSTEVPPPTDPSTEIPPPTDPSTSAEMPPPPPAPSTEILPSLPVPADPLPLPVRRRPLNSPMQVLECPVPAKQQKLEPFVKKYSRYVGIKQRKLDNSTN